MAIIYIMDNKIIMQYCSIILVAIFDKSRPQLLNYIVIRNALSKLSIMVYAVQENNHPFLLKKAYFLLDMHHANDFQMHKNRCNMQWSNELFYNQMAFVYQECYEIYFIFLSLMREQGINSKENTVEPSCKSIDQNVSYTQVDYHVLCKTAK